MLISSLYSSIVAISPGIEIFFRKFYWSNVATFKKLKPGPNERNKNLRHIDFDRIIDNLKSRGVTKGSIAIVHSSYDLLENSGLSCEEINSKLIELVGKDGTLVMPAIRRYKEEGNLENYLTKSMDNIICKYDVQKSMITSGFLPYSLMQRPDCFVSRFPVNPVVAVGKNAKKMTDSNLEGDILSAHGPNSSWKYCIDNNALVIGLGVDMPHSLTITHVNEECSENWPIKDWYRKRIFEIKEQDFIIQKEVYERKPIWGAIYLAENKYRKDLLRKNILKIEKVEGLNISIVESNRLMSFLHNHPRKGYPYYVGHKYLKD